MAVGDHLAVSYGIYTHHGIDIGDGTVVTFSKNQGAVCRVSFVEFSDGRDVWARKYAQCDSAPVVVSRAIQCSGETGYDLFANNCEHFATWCKTGRRESAQVRAGLRQFASAATKCSAVVTTKALAKGSSKLGAKGMTRAATPWLLLADLAQLGTEIAASNTGADPKSAELVGQGVGLVGSVGIGAAVGGPMGAGVGFGLWLFGEAVGSLGSSCIILFACRNERFSPTRKKPFQTARGIVPSFAYGG